MPPLPKYSPGPVSWQGFSQSDFNSVPANSLMEELQKQQQVNQALEIQKAQAAKAQREEEALAKFSEQVQSGNVDMQKVPELLMQLGMEAASPELLAQADRLSIARQEQESREEARKKSIADMALKNGDFNLANSILTSMGLPPVDANVVGREIITGRDGEILERNNLTGSFKVLRQAQPDNKVVRPIAAEDQYGNLIYVHPVTGERMLPDVRPPRQASLTDEVVKSYRAKQSAKAAPAAPAEGRNLGPVRQKKGIAPATVGR